MWQSSCMLRWNLHILYQRWTDASQGHGVVFDSFFFFYFEKLDTFAF